MLKNYFTIGIRNLIKYKGFSFINSFGLALAMCVGMLVILMLSDQRRYDQFHGKKERIYRIFSDRENSKFPSATTPFALADALKIYPIIEKSTHLTRGVARDFVFKKQATDVRGYFAEQVLFEVFDFPFVSGDPSNALSSPNSIVITNSFARKIFGELDPTGQVVEIRNAGSVDVGGSDNHTSSWGEYTITGVIADEEYRSHLEFDILVSASTVNILAQQGKIDDFTNDWHNNNSYTYVLLADNKRADDLAASLADLRQRRKQEVQKIAGFALMPQALTSITPGILLTNETRVALPLAAYYVLFALALVILTSACLNYASLSTARALTRAKEIGIRKVAGAYRRDVVLQFLGEAIIISICALAIGSVMLLGLKTVVVASWMNQFLEFDLHADPLIYLIFILFAIGTGVVAGIFPALYFSRFRPITALKARNGSPGAKVGVRKILAVCQFIISLFFITTSLLLVSQFTHFMHFEYGFNATNIINVPLQGNDYQKIANKFKAIPGIATVSACNYVPSTGINNGISVKSPGTDNNYHLCTILVVDENFIANMGIDLIAGQNILISDSASRSILVNQAAVKTFGYKHHSEILGQQIATEGGEMLEVIGVVNDFYVKAPFGADGIDPLILRNVPQEYAVANVKITSPDLTNTIRTMEKEWKSLDVYHPFRYDFYDEQLADMHRGLFDIVSIVGFLAFISISISCLGLLGMAAYVAERKTKEIGIRKILGARAASVALLLSRDFLKVILISIFIGAPLSFYANNLWLQRFPNRVDFGFQTIALGSLMLLVLGIITIGSQTIRASQQNPTEALKSE